MASDPPFPVGRNYYALLGVPPTASDAEVRRAYRRLMIQWHPDKRGSGPAGALDPRSAAEVFRSIQEAYDTLACPEKRCLYDFLGAFAALAGEGEGEGAAEGGAEVGAPLGAAHATTASPGDPGCGAAASAERQGSGPASGLAAGCSLSSSGSGSGSGPSGGWGGPASCSSSAACGGRTGTSLPHRDWSPDTASAPAHGPAHSLPHPHPHPHRPHHDQQHQHQPHPWQQSPPQPPAEPSLPLPFEPGRAGRALGTCGSWPPAPAPLLLHVSAPPPTPQPSPGAVSPGSLLGKRRGGAGAEAVLPCAGSSAPASSHHRLLLTLEEMFSGCVKELRLARRVYRPASDCGMGPGPGAAACASAPGGWPGPAARLALGLAAHAHAHAGAALDDAAVCGAGGGPVETRVEELFRVALGPGTRTGTRVTFSGKGDEGAPGLPAGDLVLVVAQADHDRFERRGNDLHTTLCVPLVDALTGGAAALRTLDGRSLTLPLGPGVFAGECVLPGEGMPIPRSRTGGAAAAAAAAARGGGAGTGSGSAPARSHGDLVVHWRVAFPEQLSGDQRDALRQALQPQHGAAPS